MRIRLAQTPEERAACVALLRQMYHELPEAEFHARAVAQEQVRGYQIAYVETDGQPLAMAGFRVLELLVSGRQLYVDDLLTDAAWRGQGLGGRLFAWLLDRARETGCRELRLDCDVPRARAHRFYFRQGLHIASFHFRLRNLNQCPATPKACGVGGVGGLPSEARIGPVRSTEDVSRCYPVMAQLRPQLSHAEFCAQVARQQADGGYELAMLELGGVPVAVAGYRHLYAVPYHRFLYVDDLVTAAEWRGRGWGATLFDHLVEYARQAGCLEVQLDSGLWRSDAHRFYFRQGMHIAAFHFRLEVQAPAGG
ncbi:MAG TPA: GNAT family N-acetyltransferase [Phycisphaerae bacterium]|nr:GNAT family N-acetyltransferase [Phycisphaerae bacterium]HNU44052.1 GNAT family N-acetyltransferase [Phycisphaerae bacterium]